MLRTKQFILFLLAFALLAGSASAQTEYKVRLKKADGSGGLIVRKNAANRTAAETAALADSDKGSDTAAVDVEKMDSGEAAARGMATQTTLAEVAADASTLADEVVQTGNSSTATLSGSATFAGTYVDVAGKQAIRIAIRTDQDSATNGLVISWSKDGTNAVATQSFTVTAAADFLETLPVRARYVKCAYTNGGVAQGAFDQEVRSLGGLPTVGTSNVPLRVDPTGTTTQPVSVTNTVNTETTILASAARTTTQTGSDQTNTSGKGAVVTLDITSAGTGSITLSVEGKDPTSGKYYAIITGNAETTNVTRVYRIYPGLTASANATVSDVLPKTFRVNVTANNANSVTYSVGCTVMQ